MLQNVIYTKTLCRRWLACISWDAFAGLLSAAASRRVDGNVVKRTEQFYSRNKELYLIASEDIHYLEVSFQA